MGPALKIGVWRHFGEFDSLRYDSAGVSLADPAAASPRRLCGDLAGYAAVDARVWADADGKRKPNGFVRGSIAPSDRNEVDRYLDCGVAFTGPLAQRPEDELGLAIGVARISPALAGLTADATNYSAAPPLHPSRETAVELTYTVKLSTVITLQPDVQYVRRPNGGLAQTNGGPPLRDATVVGFRTSLQF